MQGCTSPATGENCDTWMTVQLQSTPCANAPQRQPSGSYHSSDVPAATCRHFGRGCCEKQETAAVKLQAHQPLQATHRAIDIIAGNLVSEVGPEFIAVVRSRVAAGFYGRSICRSRVCCCEGAARAIYICGCARRLTSCLIIAGAGDRTTAA